MICLLVKLSFLFYIWGFHWVGKALQDEGAI